MSVLDTSVVSEAMKPEPNPAVRAWLNEQVAETLYLSSLTLAELAVKARTAGKGFPTPDGYIGAVAASRGFIVATRDTRPFDAAGLTVINPWDHQ